VRAPYDGFGRAAENGTRDSTACVRAEDHEIGIPIVSGCNDLVHGGAFAKQSADFDTWREMLRKSFQQSAAGVSELVPKSVVTHAQLRTEAERCVDDVKDHEV
jgi:hypothetical protein